MWSTSCKGQWQIDSIRTRNSYIFSLYPEGGPFWFPTYNLHSITLFYHQVLDLPLQILKILFLMDKRAGKASQKAIIPANKR